MLDAVIHIIAPATQEAEAEAGASVESRSWKDSLDNTVRPYYKWQQQTPPKTQMMLHKKICKVIHIDKKTNQGSLCVVSIKLKWEG